MSAYRAILSARFRILLQYRAAAIAGFSTQVFWGLIRVMIFTAFFESSTAEQPMSLQATIDYIWLGQALLLMLPWNMDRDIEQMIRTGNVAYELLRPVDVYWMWFFRGIALRLAPVILRVFPLFFLAVLFFNLHLPVSFTAGGLFLTAMGISLVLSSAITTLMSISLFWTLSGQGVSRLIPSSVIIFSGIIIPLPFFPEWLQPIIEVLPFRGILDVPFQLYIGLIPANQALPILAQQIVWAIILIAIGKYFTARGLKHVVVQGG